jgi:hypothetical protein
MPEKPQKWYRLHLRTRLVMIAVVGALVYVNTRAQNGPLETVPMVQPASGMIVHLMEHGLVRGWPLILYKSYSTGYTEWSAAGIACDVAVGLSITVAIVATGEWILRRRERKRA